MRAHVRTVPTVAVSDVVRPVRSAAAKLEHAITGQNESYLNNQTDQQALLLRHERARAFYGSLFA